MLLRGRLIAMIWPKIWPGSAQLSQMGLNYSLVAPLSLCEHNMQQHPNADVTSTFHMQQREKILGMNFDLLAVHFRHGYVSRAAGD